MQKMSQEEIDCLLEKNLKTQVQTWLNEYQGEGKKIFDFRGKEERVVKIVMTDKQLRWHDRDYRARLIREGLLRPKG